MEAVVYALISVCAAALVRVTLRSSLVCGLDPILTLVFYNLGAFLLLFCCLPTPVISMASTEAIPLLLLNGVVWSGAVYLDVKSAQLLDASIGELFGTLSFVGTTLAGILLFNEQLSKWGVLGIVMIIVAGMQVVGVSTGGKVPACGKIAGYILKSCAATLSALGLILDKFLLHSLPSEAVVLSGFFIPGAAFLVIGYRQVPKIVSEIAQLNRMFLLLPVLGAISYTCCIKAFALGSLTVSTTIFQLCIAIILMIEILYLGMRDNLFHRITVCATCMLGAVLVAAT